jgi:carboxypeptidase C (cathepsin A)
MRKILTCAVLALFACAPLAFAAERDETPKPEAKADSGKPEAHEKSEAVLEKAVSTAHSVQIGGRNVAYHATAGTLTIRDDKNKPDASIFYVAYTADGFNDSTKRPITFVYNGGPGSSSIWLHLGSFGPQRLVTASPQATAPAPYRLVPNEYSLLDKSDLVFIDMVGSGYSRGILNEKEKTEKDANPDKRFWGVDQDADSFARFIQRYITVNKRWNSPKFLFGESYGTTRSGALVKLLADRGIAMNGVTILSSILNYARRLPGSDFEYTYYLPSFAAIAWYHDKLPNKPADITAFLNEVRGFAAGEYAAALAKGIDLSPAEADAVAAKLNKYTGLSVAYLKETNLRIAASRFRKELLRDERLTVGRYDGRFEGIDSDAAGEAPETDASDTAISGAFTAAFHDYIERELHYSTDLNYNVSANGANMEWDWKHKAAGQQRPLPLPYVAGDIAATMRENPHLHLLSANGLFDLATPFFATEFDLKHMQIDPKLRDNLSFSYYPSGHMVYLNVDALKQLKQDVAAFYVKAAP